MRHTESKYTPTRRASPSFTSRLSYQSENTPSGWQSFPVNICPVHCRSSNPFRHLHRPTSILFPSCISSTAVSIPVFPHIRHHARPPLSSPLTLSAIPIILYLRITSIFVIPRLCCGPYHIIFHSSMYSAAVVCITSLIGYSPCSASFYTTLLAQICSTLLFYLSDLILSLHFSSLFCNGSSLSL